MFQEKEGHFNQLIDPVLQFHSTCFIFSSLSVPQMFDPLQPADWYGLTPPVATQTARRSRPPRRQPHARSSLALPNATHTPIHCAGQKRKNLLSNYFYFFVVLFICGSRQITLKYNTTRHDTSPFQTPTFRFPLRLSGLSLIFLGSVSVSHWWSGDEHG